MVEAGLVPQDGTFAGCSCSWKRYSGWCRPQLSNMALAFMKASSEISYQSATYGQGAAGNLAEEQRKPVGCINLYIDEHCWMSFIPTTAACKLVRVRYMAPPMAYAAQQEILFFSSRD